MSRIVVVHSFRGGTGKSNITANTAGLLAQRGRRVGIIDTDLQSPGIHVLFGFSGEHRPEHTLNDFLAGTATLDQVATDVSDRIPGDGGGAVQLVASSISPADIATVLRDGYDVERLNDALVQLGGYLRRMTWLADVAGFAKHVCHPDVHVVPAPEPVRLRVPMHAGLTSLRAGDE